MEASTGMLGSFDAPRTQHPLYYGTNGHQQQQPVLPATQTIAFAAVEHSSKQHLLAGDQNHVFTCPAGISTDEEEAADESGGAGKRTASPWQRMKWTDCMVRLLITVVYHVGGDDGGDGVDKKKSGVAAGGAGLLQKKGKWKSVSRAMMEKGFFVSPQQCEDKFNDLNKRYKRVNDILGRGTACRVVENQSLLETMDHISPRMKEEVRKLLNSKHLFFREMCAYHSNCAAQSSPVATRAGHHSDAQDSPGFQPQQHQLVQRGCFHNEKDEAVVDADEDDDHDEEEDDDDEIEEVDCDVELVVGMGKKRKPGVASVNDSNAALQQLRVELAKVSSWPERREWIKRRKTEVEEERIGYEREALELEKQRFKWLKYSSEKERELERLRLGNERRRLEAERMALLLRRKEIEVEASRSTTLQLGRQHACSSNVGKNAELFNPLVG